MFDEGVWLKPKTYSLLKNKTEKIYNKGVIKSQNELTHEKYRDTLFKNKVEFCKNTIIRKTTKFGKPEMNTIEIKKVGLDSWDDKRYWINSIKSIPYGMKTKGKIRTILMALGTPPDIHVAERRRRRSEAYSHGFRNREGLCSARRARLRA